MPEICQNLEKTHSAPPPLIINKPISRLLFKNIINAQNTGDKLKNRNDFNILFYNICTKEYIIVIINSTRANAITELKNVKPSSIDRQPRQRS